MEAFLVIIVIGLPAAALAGCVISVLAISRTRKLQRRVEEFEGRIIDLEARPLTAQPPVARESPDELRRPAFGEVAIPEVSDAGAPAPTPEAPPSPPQFDVHPEPPSPKEEAPAVPPTPPADQPPIPARTLEEPAAPGGATPPGSKVPKIDIDWEQWIGVRGAAAAGGIVLALAALLFFQYSIEHGLISPTMRVIFGVLVGVGCIVGSEWLIKRGQAPAANALAGAGVVILYGATWAAQTLYGLIGMVPAFVLMVVITAVCVAVAIARDARFIAVLGLLGGFATPLLVASDASSPAALFGYILLLDLGLLWLARARGWPLLAVLSLAGTALHQGLWIVGTMDAERAALGIVVLGVFGLAFLFVDNGDREHSLLWRATRAGGVAVPFAFGLHFAGTAKLADNPSALGALLVILSAGACWLARKEPRGPAVGAAGASLGVMTLWMITHRLDITQAWQAVGVCLAVAAVFLAASVIHRDHAHSRSFLNASLIAQLGFLTLLVLASGASRIHRPWPWVFAWVVLGATLIWHARRPSRAWVQPAAGLGPALGLTIVTLIHGYHREDLSSWLLAALMIALVLVFQILALMTRDGTVHTWTERTGAATALALMPAAMILTEHHRTDAGMSMVLTLVLGILAVLAATRLHSGPWFFAATLSTAFWQSLIFAEGFPSSQTVGEVALPFSLLAGTALFFTIWPVLTAKAFSGSRSAWWGAALAGPFWFPALREAFTTQWGSEAIGLLPLALAAVALVAVLRLRPALGEDTDTRFRAVVWYCAVALSLVSLAIPLQLDREWITIGWALNGLAVLALWARLDHPGLKYFGLALLGASTVRLVANPEVLSYHVRSATPVLNWLSYTYLVPATAMIFSMRFLKPREVPRLRNWEERWYPGGRAIGAAACGLAAVATVFAWINLAIADIFATSTTLELTFERLPARDATTSIAWAVYALILLAIGVRARSSSLRWLSLGLMVTTILKVFLHDLGELEDLYRVASLAGLAVSLIVVSLIYQQFVFKAAKGGDQ
ncbi:MAG: DUF2339 domain-containing protein [Acidobacteriota bacterium]